MTPGRRRLAVGVLACSALAAYDALAHYVSAHPDAAPWAALLTLGPAALLLLDLLRRHLGRAAALLGGLAGAGAAVLVWPQLRENLTQLYLAQYLGTNLMLGGYFGRSLLPGQTPACTSFAEVLQAQLSPTALRYTRQVTVAWTLFFAVSAGLSVLLYLFAPLPVWSMFTNLFYLPSLALMFIVEGLVRRSVLPPHERHGILASVNAYIEHSRAAASPSLNTTDLPPRIS